MYSKVIQLYIDGFFFWFFTILGYYKISNLVELVSLFPHYSLLGYRNTNNFYIDLISWTQLIVLIGSSVCVCVCVCVYYLGFSIPKMMSSENKRYFTSSFPMWIAFISCPCLISLKATTFSTRSKRNGESRHLCLVPNLRGIRSSSLNMIPTMGFS